MADDLQTQALGLGRLAVMLAGKRHQALGQADEARGQRAVLQHLALLVGGREFLGINPDALAHEEGRVVHLLARLNLEALIQLGSHQLQLGIEQVENRSTSPLARMAKRGKLMEVKDRLPRRA